MKSLRLAAAASAATGVLAAACAAWADVPKAQIQGVADTRLRKEIERSVGTDRNPPQSRFEARRRALSAAADVSSVLRSEGYYEAVVEPEVGEGDQPQSVVRVTPGSRFAFSSPMVSWVGEEPVRLAQLAGESAIGLTIGSPGRAADVLSAEGRVVAAVQKRGYADAKIQPREVTVDHIPRTVQPTFRIDAGGRVRMDGVKLNSTGRTHAAWVNSLAPWKAGDIYDPDQVAQLEKRLRDTSVFDSITVALSAEPNADGQRPVEVTLIDRPKSTVEMGASYSTAEGTGFESKWIRYNRLGRGDTLTFNFQAAEILSQVGVELALPNWLNAQRTLKLSSSVYRDDTNAYLETGARIGADLEQRFGRNDFFSYGLSALASRDAEPQVIGGVLVKKERPLTSIIGSTALSLDHSNDILNPTKGWRFEVRAEPSAAFGSGPINYIRAQAQASAYVPFDTAANTVVAARVRVGDIFNGGIPSVPASRRFYSGGGGSVRGYAYQGVGPRFPNNTPQGGISLLETSVELRRKIAGPFGAVLFVDSGVLGSRQTFDLAAVSTGVGFGLRYDLGFAPFRVDIAAPMQKRSGDAAVQIYLSIGQSF